MSLNSVLFAYKNIHFVICAFQNGSLPFNKFEFLVTWLFREVSSPYLLLAAHLNPTIRWKTRSFRLRWGGKAEPIGEIVVDDAAMTLKEKEKFKL